MAEGALKTKLSVLGNPRVIAAKHRGGRGLCAACGDPQQSLINSELAAGRSLLSLSKRFGISRPALLAHKRNHLSPSLVAIRRVVGAGDVVAELHDLTKRARRYLDTAELAGNQSQALAALRELRETLIVIGR